MTSCTKAFLAGAAACLLAAEAQAYTISGIVPAGRAPVTVNLRQPLQRGNITFNFKAGVANAGVAYALSFCIGPESNPCGAPLSHAIEVPAGEAKTFSIDALVFSCNVLTVGQGTRVRIPYTIDVVQP